MSNTPLPHSHMSLNEDPLPPGVKHVLVVDSNALMGRILGHMIKRLHLKCTTSTNGEGAVALCRSNKFHLIMMEVNMPGMSGVDASHRIRPLSDHYAQVPIIAISTNITEQDIAHYRTEGLNGEIKKPVNETNLMDVLHKRLGIPLDEQKWVPPSEDEVLALLDEEERKLINWTTLQQYHQVMGDEFPPMLHEYIETSPDLVWEIGVAAIAQDGEKLKFMAHQLKSVSLIFGSEGVSNMAAQLEIMGRSDKMDDAKQFYNKLLMSFACCQPILRKKLKLMQKKQ